MWAPEFLAGRACPSAGRAVEATGAREYGDRHDVRYADEERRTSNVQLSTFNGVTERAYGGRDMGTDMELRRHLSLGFACLYYGVAICSVCILSRRREPGAGDEVEADISKPGGAELSDQRRGGRTASLDVRQLWLRLRRAEKYKCPEISPD